MKKLSLISITAASLLLAVCTQASQVHKHKSTSINGCDNTIVKQSCAKTITSLFDKKGNLWTAWTHNKTLYVNYSTNDGKTFSPKKKVNTIPEKISARKEHRPKIAISEDGIIYLSWTTKLEKRFTGNIRFSRSIDQGNSFSKPITVNDNLDIISHRFDALTVNKRGNIYISWLDKRDQQAAKRTGKKYNGAAAYYAVSTNQGLTFDKNKKITDHSCECCRMAIDIDKHDLPVIAWRHIYGDNIRDHSIVSFSDINTPSTPKRLSNDKWKMTGCPHHGPSLSINKDNRYHSVWFNNAKKRHGIFYAHSDDQGNTFSEAVSIGNYDKQASHADVMAVNSQVNIVWKEFEAPYTNIYIMTSNDNGLNWSQSKLISKSTKTSDYAFLINNENKTFVSWHIPGDEFKLIHISNHNE